MLKLNIINPFNLLLAFLVFLLVCLGKTTGGGRGSVEIGLYFVLLFFWAARSERSFSPILVLLIGFIQDALTGSVFGTWPLVFAAFFALIRSQALLLRQGPRSLIFFVLIFSLFICYAILAVIALLLDNRLDFVALSTSFSLTVAVVPLAAVFLSFIIPLEYSSFKEV